jgi:hypothetical protein
MRLPLEPWTSTRGRRSKRLTELGAHSAFSQDGGGTFGETLLLNESLASRHHGYPRRREDPNHLGAANLGMNRYFRGHRPVCTREPNAHRSSTWSPAGGVRENQARLLHLLRGDEARQHSACHHKKDSGQPPSPRHGSRTPAVGRRTPTSYVLVVDC